MSSIASYMQANTANESNSRLNRMQTDEPIGNEEPQGQVKKFRLKLSQRLHHAAELAFVSYLLLMVSFGSPYWLASYTFTHSAFKRLGLWDFCFQNYVHPTYQYDTRFSGCHWIYSPIYANIRDALQPAWFMFVQANITLALCLSTIGLTAISIIFMHFMIQYQLIILCITLLCQMATTMLLGFGLLTFYLKSYDRNWILYPDYNYLGWSYYFALFSMFGNGVASYLFYREVRDLKQRVNKLKRLIAATDGADTRLPANGDEDSIDAVYSSRSLDVYQSVPMVGNESQRSRSQQQQQNERQAPESAPKHSGLMYPYYTQV